jgi:hypothetical protein
LARRNDSLQKSLGRKESVEKYPGEQVRSIVRGQIADKKKYKYLCDNFREISISIEEIMQKSLTTRELSTEQKTCEKSFEGVEIKTSEIYEN